MRKIITIIVLSILLILPLIPSIQAENISFSAKIKDRYTGNLVIEQIFSQKLKEKYDLDHSGFLDKYETYALLKEHGVLLNFTPLGNFFYEIQNISLDGRKPIVNSNNIEYSLHIPIPVNGTTNSSIKFNFTFYLNGTYDHFFKISIPNRSGLIAISFPNNDTILQSNLINKKINKNSIEGYFKNSIYIKFREENYYWMNIYSVIIVIGAIGAFVFMAYKFRGGRVKGVKLLIRSIIRNLIALFVVLTILFYILWVIGPPPSVRIGGLSTMLMRFYIIQYYHLDRPWYEQYINWWHLIFTGGITKGVGWGIEELNIRFAIIISLTIFILTSLITYLSSLYLAIRKKSPHTLDVYAAIFLALYSIPTFYASLLILHSFEGWPLLYKTLVAPTNGWEEGIRIIIASIILSLLTIARPYLIARSMANKEYMEPYVKTFHAVGLRRKDLRKFIKKSTMIPTTTDLSLNFGWILTAQAFLEVIFHIKGMGMILFMGTINGNPFQIQIAIIYFAAVMIAASIFSDIVIYFLDPRVRR
jgi:peptide/nickel transport system permease protein